MYITEIPDETFVDKNRNEIIKLSSIGFRKTSSERPASRSEEKS
jgi:hypothetical protein